MKVLVSLTPWPSERQYDMPGDETISLLYRLGENLIDAMAYADDSRRFAPDSEIPELILELWAEELHEP